MIRVSVLYPRTEGKKFDMDYYSQKHMPMVADKAKPLRVEIDKPVATPGQDSPFFAIGHMYYDSVDDFQQAFGASGGEIMGDIPNYTDLQPQIQISEIVE